MSLKSDLTGKKFGKLIATEFLSEHRIKDHIVKGNWWKCSYSCGGTAIVKQSSLISKTRRRNQCPTNEFKNKREGAIVDSWLKNTKMF